ncbi:MAG: sulfotransferase, partial [Ilumatobacteraceae bacterium]
MSVAGPPPADRSSPVASGRPARAASAGLAPFPFLVGCGRSGTTLVRAMLDAHPDVAVPDEVAFVIRYARPHYALHYGWPRRFDVGRCAALLTADASFRRWGLGTDQVAAALSDPAPATYAETVRRLYAAAAAARGKPRYADKTPSHVLHLRRLARTFPESKFVHVVRDGRDVAMSYRSVAWGPSSVEEAALRWRRSVRRGRIDGRHLGADRYCEVRYEELVADPRTVMLELCRFLELPWDEAVLRHQERAADVIAATRFPDAHRRLLLPPTPGLRDWRREMPPADVARFEAIAGGTLDELGYRRGSRPSITRRPRAVAQI